MDARRLARRFRAVIAGSGFLARECRFSIIQLAMFSDCRAVITARQSGMSAKRLEERSRECKVLAKGARLLLLIEVRELSAKLRCRKNLHFDAGRIGRIPMLIRLDELPLRR